MGVAAMILGIVCLVSITYSWTGFGAIVGVVSGIIAIILGACSRRNRRLSNAQHGMGTTGFVMGIIGTVINIGLGLVGFLVFLPYLGVY